MKTILLKILHYIWFRKDNLYSIYKSITKNTNIKIDGKVDFNEFKEYHKIFKESWVTRESFELDDNIISWDIISDNLNPNKSKRLTICSFTRRRDFIRISLRF